MASKIWAAIFIIVLFAFWGFVSLVGLAMVVALFQEMW